MLSFIFFAEEKAEATADTVKAGSDARIVWAMEAGVTGLERALVGAGDNSIRLKLVSALSCFVNALPAEDLPEALTKGEEVTALGVRDTRLEGGAPTDVASFGVVAAVATVDLLLLGADVDAWVAIARAGVAELAEAVPMGVAVVCMASASSSARDIGAPKSSKEMRST